MNLKNRMIMEEFHAQRADFIELGNIVRDMLSEIVKELNIEIMGIEHRVKTEDSLKGKLERKGDRYTSLFDLTDILGARIICFFADDVDKVGQKIEEKFEIDWENSVDKRKDIRADSFGYLSLHYICSLPSEDKWPESLRQKKFEIQIRSTLQHIWAVINHDTGYKNEFGVPRAVVRNFSRLAGLMELADDEFVRVRDAMAQYTNDIRQKIADNCADDVLLDMVSLREFIRRNTVMKGFLEELGAISGAEISEITADPYIDQLRWLGIKTLGDLQNLLSKNKDLALALAHKTLADSELDILSSNVGLRFICRAALYNGGYTLEQAAEFLNLSIGNAFRAANQAKNLFESCKALSEGEI